MTPGEALQRAFADLDIDEDLEPEPEDLSEALERYSTVELLEGAGIRRVPPPSRGGDLGAYKRYRTAQRAVQRARETGPRGGRQKRSGTRGAAQWILDAARSLARDNQGRLDAVESEGLTVRSIEARVIVRSGKGRRRDDDRERFVSVAVYIRDTAAIVEAARAGDWELAADAFTYAWGIAYGIGPGVIVPEIDSLELSLGRDDDVAYEYGGAA